ncbi:hypothetical protein F4679DRAFT_555408 [Xylaria curta]|nr:hypothetical protein F4679DRAFT_555408 [Xylaria curta]
MTSHEPRRYSRGHEDDTQDHLHHLGRLEFHDRDNFSEDTNIFWEQENEVRLGSILRDAKKALEESESGKIDYERELKRIGFLRKTLAGEKTESRLIERLEESRLEWRESEAYITGIDRARMSRGESDKRDVPLHRHSMPLSYIEYMEDADEDGHIISEVDPKYARPVATGSPHRQQPNTGKTRRGSRRDVLISNDPTTTKGESRKEVDEAQVKIHSSPPTAIISPTPTVSLLTSPRLEAPGSTEQGSETETKNRTMLSYPYKYPQDLSAENHSSKSKAKNNEWTIVTEPEERRRIQNRIAQRNFRKQREHRERAERDDRNQENAGSSYRVPYAGELGPDDVSKSKSKYKRRSSAVVASSKQRPTIQSSKTGPPVFDNRDYGPYEPEKDLSVYILQFENGKGTNAKDGRVRGTFPNQTTTIAKLLPDIDRKASLLHEGQRPGCIRYLHIQANNVQWAEDILSQYFGDGPEIAKGTSDYTTLRKSYWGDQSYSHYDVKTPPNSRHIQPSCTVVSAATDGAESSSKDIALFMPYLHWETCRKQKQFATEIDHIMAEADMRNSRLGDEDKVKRGEEESMVYIELESLRRSNSQRERTRKSLSWLGQLSNWTKKQIPTKPRRVENLKARRTGSPKLVNIRHQVNDEDRIQVGNPLGRYLFLASKIYESMENYRDKMLLRKYLLQELPIHPRRTLDQAARSAFYSDRQRDKTRGLWPEHESFKTTLLTSHDKADIKKAPFVTMVDQLWMWILDEKILITCFPKQYGSNEDDKSGVHKSIRIRLKGCGPDQIRSVFDLALLIIDECCNNFFDQSDKSNKTLKITRRIERIQESSMLGSRTNDVGCKPRYYDATLLDVGPERELEEELDDITRELDVIIHITEDHKDILQKFVSNAERMLDPIGIYVRNKDSTTSRNLWELSRADDGEYDNGSDDTKRRGDYYWFKKNADELHAKLNQRAKELEILRSTALQAATKLEALRTLKQQLNKSDRKASSTAILMCMIVTIIFLPLSFLSATFGMNNAYMPIKLSYDQERPRLTLTNIISYVFSLSVTFTFCAWILMVIMLLKSRGLNNIYSMAFAYMSSPMSNREKTRPEVETPQDETSSLRALKYETALDTNNQNHTGISVSPPNQPSPPQQQGTLHPPRSNSHGMTPEGNSARDPPSMNETFKNGQYNVEDYKNPNFQPLSKEPSSERRAQNRAAQSAFRERKGKHLKDLEAKLEELEKASSATNDENTQLRSQLEELTVNLEQYKKTLSVSSSTLRPLTSSSRDYTSSSAVHNMNDVNLQFEAPRFSMFPGPSSKLQPEMYEDAGDGTETVVQSSENETHGVDESRERMLVSLGSYRHLGYTRRFIRAIVSFMSAWISRVPEGTVRVTWKCRCGKRLHIDVDKRDEQEAVSYAQQASGSPESVRVLSGYSNTKGDDSQSTKLTGDSDRNSLTHHSSKDTNQSTTLTAQQMLPSFPRGAKRYLLLCVTTGLYQIKLAQIDVTNVAYDATLYSKIRETYSEMRGPLSKNILIVPKTVEYVKFELIRFQKSGACVGNYETNSIPSIKEVLQQEYAFNPCPPRIGRLPIQPHIFMHSFLNPGDHSGSLAVSQLPKKINEMLRMTELDNSQELPYGWGIFIVEGFNETLVAYILLLVLSIILLVVVLWSSLLKDISGGVGIGQFGLGFAAILFPAAIITLRSCFGFL